MNKEYLNDQLFTLWSNHSVTDKERDETIRLILAHLRMEIWRTNRTDSGNTELVIRQD